MLRLVFTGWSQCLRHTCRHIVRDPIYAYIRLFGNTDAFMEFAREIHESDTILKAEPIIGVKCALISKGHLLILITLRSEEKLIRLTYFILEIYILLF